VGELHRIKTKLLWGLLWSENKWGELTMARWSAAKGGRGGDPVGKKSIKANDGRASGYK
jgi:hypothetical protein